MEMIENWDELVEAFEQIEWTPTHQVEGGTVYKPSKQLGDSFDDADWYQSEWFTEEEQEGIERHTLLAMNWESHGAPISWDGFLETVQVGDQAAYVFLWLEGITDKPDLLGKVVPAQAPAAYRALYLDLMRSSDVFLIVPDHTYNGRPDLLDQAIVRQGFQELMNRVGGEQDLGWDELRMRLENPVHGLVSSSMVKTLEPGEDDAPPLSEAERQALLDRYFAENYEEAEEK